VPGDGVLRPLSLIPPEELQLAVLYIVEDQFGYPRDAMPRAIAEVFGFERTRAGTAQIVGEVVDGLIDRAGCSDLPPLFAHDVRSVDRMKTVSEARYATSWIPDCSIFGLLHRALHRRCLMRSKRTAPWSPAFIAGDGCPAPSSRRCYS